MMISSWQPKQNFEWESFPQKLGLNINELASHYPFYPLKLFCVKSDMSPNKVLKYLELCWYHLFKFRRERSIFFEGFVDRMKNGNRTEACLLWEKYETFQRQLSYSQQQRKRSWLYYTFRQVQDNFCTVKNRCFFSSMLSLNAFTSSFKGESLML